MISPLDALGIITENLREKKGKFTLEFYVDRWTASLDLKEAVDIYKGESSSLGIAIEAMLRDGKLL